MRTISKTVDFGDHSPSQVYRFLGPFHAILSIFQIQLTTLSVCVTLSATVALACLYAPKLWIVLFEPEKNVRERRRTAVGTHWAMLLPDPSMYTPLLALRAVQEGQNVYLAPPNLIGNLNLNFWDRFLGPFQKISISFSVDHSLKQIFQLICLEKIFPIVDFSEAFRDRRSSSNAGRSLPENGTTVTVHTSEHTSDLAPESIS